MPRHSGGGGAGVRTKRSGGRSTRRLHNKSTYQDRQTRPSPYWSQAERTGVHNVVAPEPRHRMPEPLGMTRKNKPNPKTKPQNPKRPKGGSK